MTVLHKWNVIFLNYCTILRLVHYHYCVISTKVPGFYTHTHTHTHKTYKDEKKQSQITRCV
jgi:hypothetical protein